MPAPRLTGENRIGDGSLCPIVESLKIIGSMWKMVVIRYLMDGPKGFNELLRSAPSLHAKTLSRILKELQAEGIVERTVVSTQPFAVRYSLTAKGMDLSPAFEALRAWGAKWVLSPEAEPKQESRGNGP